MNRIKSLLVCFPFLFCFPEAFSQQDSLQIKVDGLRLQISQANDVRKLSLLDSLCQLTRFNSDYDYETTVKELVAVALELNDLDMGGEHTADYIFYLANRAGKPKEAVQVFDAFRERELLLSDPSIKARIYLNGADGYFFSGQTAESIPFYRQAGSYAREAQDSILWGKSKIYMSDAYADGGQFAEAGSVLSDAEEIFITFSDTLNLMTTRNSRANLYSRIGFFREAEEVRKELIQLAISRKDYRMLQSTYYNMAIDKRQSNELQSAIVNLKEAMKYAQLGNYESYQMRILINLLRTYSVAGNVEEASKTLNLIQNHAMVPKDGGLDDFSYVEAQANYQLALGNNMQAINLSNRLFQLDSKNDFANGMNIHNILTKAYENLGNTAKSYEHYKAYSSIRDSINAIQNVQSLTYYQTLYETKKRDATIESQESEIALLDAKNKLSKQWMLLGGMGLLALYLILFLMRSRKFAVSEQIMQEQFSRDLINEQERERTHLARELHDSVGQKLMLLSKQTKKIGDENTQELADTTLEEIRSISRGLHPSNLERLGLTASINSLIYNINANSDLFFTESIENVDGILEKESELHLYRILQETLSNIVKHAEAKAVKVNIRKAEKEIKVLISDNGKGFNVEEKKNASRSLGMKTLLERAKIINTKLNIESNLGQGTVIKMVIPFKNTLNVT
ncbi:MAG: hypothetical protein Aureis2KO_27530 [Aureisphaera sp.]